MKIKAEKPFPEMATGTQVLRIIGVDVKNIDTKNGCWRLMTMRLRSLDNGATTFVDWWLECLFDEEKNQKAMKRLGGLAGAVGLDEGMDFDNSSLWKLTDSMRKQLLGRFFKARLKFGDEYNGKKKIEIERLLEPDYSDADREKMMSLAERFPTEELKGWGTDAGRIDDSDRDFGEPQAKTSSKKKSFDEEFGDDDIPF